MNKRKEYRSMLFFTYSVVLFIYGSVAVVGYATYGNNTKQEVTLNMTSSFVSSITTWMVILNPLTKYALSLSPGQCILFCVSCPQFPMLMCGFSRLTGAINGSQERL